MAFGIAALMAFLVDLGSMITPFESVLHPVQTDHALHLFFSARLAEIEKIRKSSRDYKSSQMLPKAWRAGSNRTASSFSSFFQIK